MQPLPTIGDGHRPLRDKVVEELRRRIVDGDYAPGDRLPEDKLAEAFGVSRNPVREAIRVLEAEGFVVAQPRRGAAVATLSVQDVEDLFDVRLALEPLAARLAAQRSGQTAATALGEITSAAKDAASNEQLDTVADLNTRFHATVCDFSGNVLLQSMTGTLHARLQWVYRQSAADRGPHSWAEHESLVAAIRAGDGDKAEAEAQAHVRNARAAAFALAQ